MAIIKRIKNTIKANKDFKKKVVKESDQIFTKIYQGKYKEFPTIKDSNINTEYSKDYDKVYKQVKKVRKAQRKTK